MEKLSVIIITFNEEKNIAATLDAAWKVADEILVADSGSTDLTKNICIQKKATFFFQSWLGYGGQRNAAVAKAANEYILVVDADEVLDDIAVEAILALKSTGFTEKIYALQRRNSYYGKFIRYGMESADIKARLYHRDSAYWSDKLVHEDLEYASTLQAYKLPGYLMHYTYRTIAEHVQKTDKYTSLAASDYFRRGKSKPGFIKLMLSPAFTFINAFIFKVGFLDGWHGWILAKMHAHAVFLKYAKLRMLYFQEKQKPL